jgi:hypothetical protein
LLDLALRHARTIRVVIGELAKLNAERELRIITRQLADLTRRAEPAPDNTGTHHDHTAAHAFPQHSLARRSPVLPSQNGEPHEHRTRD